MTRVGEVEVPYPFNNPKKYNKIPLDIKVNTYRNFCKFKE